jgi:hypothetical protein
MSTKLKPITVWLRPELLESVAQLVREDRRPASQLVRNFIEDAIAARRADVGEMNHA